MSQPVVVARFPRLPALGVPVGWAAAGAAMLVALALGWAMAEWKPAFEVAVGIAAAVGISVAVRARPGAAVLLVVLLSPIYGFAFVQLRLAGVPAYVLGAASYWKEVVLAVLLVAVLARRHDRWSTADTAAMAFLAVLGVYLLLPLGGDLFARIVSAEQDGAFVVLFLACRHLDLDPRVQRRLELGILATGVVFAIGAFWNHFQPFYWQLFIGWLTTGNPLAPSRLFVESIGGSPFIRSGSFLGNYLTLPYYLLIPFCIALSYIALGRAKPWHFLVAAVCAGGIILTLTRSAIVVMSLSVLLAMVAGRRRFRLVVLLGLGLLVLLPAIDYIGLGQRLQLGFNPTDPGTQGHVNALQESLTRMLGYPLGAGLATAGNLSRRFSVAGGLINESWYLQLGTEVGLLGMLLYVAMLWAALRQLWRLAHDSYRPAIAAVCALFAIAAGGLVLHTLEDRSVAWALWAYVGLVSSRGWALPAPDAALVGGTAQ